MAKNPPLSDAEQTRLENIFHRTRDRFLRQWYAETQSPDDQVRATAQARLQLQLWLRERRKEVSTLRVQRDACKAEGDVDGMEQVRRKLKRAQCAMATQASMAVEGIPSASAMRACRKWGGKNHALEEVLGEREWDRKMEFGVGREMLLVADGDDDEVGGSLVLEDGLAGLKIKEGGDEEAEEKDDDDDESVNLNEETHTPGITTKLTSDPKSLWVQHALHIQQRQRTLLPSSSIETQLAFQKKLFDQHIERELQIGEAKQVTFQLCQKPPWPLREGVHTSWNTVLATPTFSEHNIWELTSPQLWRLFKDVKNWDYPLWVPRGVLRIQTVAGVSMIYLEIGRCSFSSKAVCLPSRVGVETVVIPMRCHPLDMSVDVEIVFFTQGFLRVYLASEIIAQSHVGCKGLPLVPVELTGMWMGVVE